MSAQRMALADGVALAARMLRERADSGNEQWRVSETARESRRLASYLDACIPAVLRGEYDAEIGRPR